MGLPWYVYIVADLDSKANKGSRMRRILENTSQLSEGNSRQI